MTLTIVGLGPGHPEELTRRAWRILQEAPELYLRTARHPVVDALQRSFHSFDSLYDMAENFDDLYAEIADHVLDEVRQGKEVVYAVPGHPLVGERTVGLILERAAGLAVTVVDGLSFIEPALTMLGIDGMAGLQIHDAVEIAAMYHPPLNPDQPVLLGQVYSHDVASNLKLTLMNQYPDEHPVTLLHRAGLPDALSEQIMLYEIDRSKEIGHLTSLYVPPLPESGSFERFQETIAHLRAPEGCPWDRKQTHQSLRRYLLEETYEVIEALDADDVEALCEELGDLLLQVVLHSQIAIDEGTFTMAQIVGGINAKIIRRHPHVWGDEVVHDEADLRRVWDRQKRAEKGNSPEVSPSLLDGIPKALPALASAEHYQKAAAKVGFDWNTIDPVIGKIFEEIEEIKSAPDETMRASEVGDLLFAMVNWSRWLDVDPETALREANRRFRKRFEYIENQASSLGLSLEEMSLEEMDRLWDEAKKARL